MIFRQFSFINNYRQLFIRVEIFVHFDIINFYHFLNVHIISKLSFSPKLITFTSSMLIIYIDNLRNEINYTIPFISHQIRYYKCMDQI